MFYYSLPIIFKHTSLLTINELLAISVSLFFILFISSPQPNPISETNSPSTSFYHHLYSAWCGNQSLWKVFWPFFILLNFSLVLIDYYAKSGILTVSSWDTLHFVLIIPIAWWGISIWRNSSRTSSRLWIALARLISIGIVFEYIIKIYIRIDLPRVFFNCQELMLDYGGCF